MSARKGAVTLVCDDCTTTLTVGLTTVKATREHAHRRGWQVSLRGDPRAGVSTDPHLPDRCRDCARKATQP